jgi:hypothetical protein
MQVQQLINQAGPLPLKGGFIADTKDSALLVVTGSLVSQTANVLLQMSVSLDGKQIGVAQLWSNGANTHRVLPTLFIGLPPLGPGQHTIMLNLLSPYSGADLNDYFSASLIFE